MEQAVISSPLGPLTLFAEDGHLTALVYGDYGGYDDLPLFREAKRQLEEYFAGQRHTFSLPMAPDGTEFQCRVWQVLQDIPYGTAISYRELADRVGSPRAFQAVGQANGRNPLPILIPCHRVIASNGTLGGYSGGVERKRYLLQREGVSVPEPKPRKPRRKREVGAHWFPTQPPGPVGCHRSQAFSIHVPRPDRSPDGGVFCGKGGRKGESFLHFEWQIFYCGLVWLGFCHFLQNPSPFGETVKKNCKNIFYLI